MVNKLTNCRVCGADIAKSASKCPHCGAYRPPIARNPLMVGTISVILIFLMVFLAAQNLVWNRVNRPDAPIEVSVSDLWSVYQENEINADSLYKNKLLSITGEVASISTYMNMPCVTVYVDDRLDYLICLFEKGDTSQKLANLRVGDAVTLQGSCSGTRMAGSVIIAQTPGYDNQYVYLNECYITSVE